MIYLLLKEQMDVYKKKNYKMKDTFIVVKAVLVACIPVGLTIYLSIVGNDLWIPAFVTTCIFIGIIAYAIRDKFKREVPPP